MLSKANGRRKSKENCKTAYFPASLPGPFDSAVSCFAQLHLLDNIDKLSRMTLLVHLQLQNGDENGIVHQLEDTSSDSILISFIPFLSSDNTRQLKDAI